ncbi:putative NACHT domain-containing protein, partial [Seiridium cardinale]
HSSDQLSFEDALDQLFETLLKQLKNIDIFYGSQQPTIFVVYAHENEPVGDARAGGVAEIIKWLRATGCQVLSDRTPRLPHIPRADNDAEVQNILSNQFCLLPSERIDGVSSERPSPYGVNERGALETVDNVILFGSEVLQCYWENESAGQYAAEISKRYNKAKETNLSREERNAHIRELVESQIGEANQSWFHHVLTELAFLDLRASEDLEHHGIIPFALDGRLLTYLPYIKHSDVHLKIDVVPDKPSFLHRIYFRLLKRIYTKAHFVIEEYESCYTASKVRLGQEGGTITRETLSNIVFEKTSEARANIMHGLDIGVRDALKLQEFDKRVNDVLSRFMEIHQGSALRGKRNDITRELSAVPYRDQKDLNPEREQDTCFWFTDHRLFRDWQYREEAALLWVFGEPGCGKSVLARYLIDDILPAPGSTVCYFFFKDSSPDQSTPVNAIRCLLQQIFMLNPAFLSGAMISKFEKSGSIYNSREELWDIFKEVTSSTSKQPIICVLDALDECEEDGRSWLMKKVGAIFNDKTTSSSFKLLLTSRPAIDLDRFVRDWQSRSFIIHLNGSNYEEATKISTEVQHVIAKGVETLGRKLQLRPRDKEDLLGTLTRFENRTYLWVTLVLKALNESSKRTKHEFPAAIREISPTVNATYEQILNRYTNKNGSEKIRILLHLVIGACRPMTLQEMSVALAITLWDPSEVLEPEPDEWIEEMINGLSGLLTIDKSVRIHLAHQTVREFLVQISPSNLPSPSQNKSGWQESFRIEESQRILAEVCLSFLEQEHSEGLAMKDYAVKNWVAHFRKSHTNDIRMKTRARNLCDPSSISFPRWYGDVYELSKEVHFRDKDALPTSPTTALMVASSLGLKVVVDLLLSEERPDLHSKDDWHQLTAFSWACRNGYKDVVESFFLYIANFSKSADVNGTLKDNILETRGCYGRTPLNHATSRNHLAVVRLLLSQGASPNSRDKFGHNVLHNAIIQGAENMVRTLLDSTAKLEGRTDRGLTALLVASSHRAKQMMAFLLSKGADVTACGNDGKTALHHIASQEWSAGIELVLKHGATIDARDEYGQTPLHMAAKSSDANAVGVLLKHGATIDARDKSGWTPLHIAAKLPDANVVGVLLKHGATIDARDKSGWTPLHIVLGLEDPEAQLTKVLLENKALVTL